MRFAGSFLLALVASGALCLCSGRWLIAQEAQAQPSTTSDRPQHPEHGPHVTGEQVTLPLVVVRGYPFLQGAIDGRPGDLMFDTGMQESLCIDTHAVKLQGGKIIGRGAFSSGQAYDVFQFPRLDHFDLRGGLHYTGLSFILGFPVAFLEQGVNPSYLGSLGTDFFSGYVFKLDYGVPSVTFYRNDASDAGERRAEAGETVIATIAAKREGHLAFPVTIGRMQATAWLDTGSHAGLVLRPEDEAAMVKTGALRRAGKDHYMLAGLVAGGQPIAPLRVEVSTLPEASNQPGPEGPIITFGYEFLRRYKTVWNYERNTFTLLQAGTVGSQP